MTRNWNEIATDVCSLLRINGQRRSDVITLLRLIDDVVEFIRAAITAQEGR
jgi:hypothetical protein